ncbi:MAG: NADH-quinone oxidoreductase subunit K [Desulfurococcales archaeon]|nr:NADH-quinone oxidoreductase subunit K [Desulfurococcales archaeon]
MSDATIDLFLSNFILIAIIGTIAVSLYGIVAKPNLIKKIIALTIFTDTANVIAILIGFRRPPSVPPVFTGALTRPPTLEELRAFASSAVDPLPQALVLTAIVIGMAVNLLIIFITLQVFRLYGTVDMRKVRELRG